MTAPKLIRVVRLDGTPMDQTYYTPEGYLVDRPILTRTGIFEYRNPDGSVRRELRLPEDVFDPESLRSYKGKPIIITHDAGLIDKDNVADESIGTILTDGYRSGDNVRAEIIIHDTDKMKESKLKELSVGYNLELEETPGTWNGMPYDAIQRNIRVNHLALVREARAGDKVRLNIDSQNANSILSGGRKTKMATKRTKKSVHGDSVLTPEELDKAIAKYLASKGKDSAVADEDDAPQTKEPKAIPTAQTEKTAPAEEPIAENEAKAETPAPKPVPNKEPAPVSTPKKEPITIGSLSKKAVPEEDEDADDEEEEEMSVEDRVGAVKDRDEKRNKQIVPDTMDDAQEVIGNQGMDIKELMDIIDTLLAERDYTKQKADSADDEEEEPEDDTEGEDYAEDEDDEDEPDEDEYEENEDEGDDEGDDEDDEDAEFSEDEDDEDEDEPNDEDEYAEDEDDEDEPDDEDEYDDYAEDEDEDEPDEDDDDYDSTPVDDEDNNGGRTDCGASCRKTRVRADSVDRIVRQRVKVGMVGRTLNLDGLENMSLKKAKKKIIHAVNPGMRLDGKSSAYIDAAYDMACTEIKKRSKKDTKYQRKQMFNADGRKSRIELEGANAARERMIKKMHNND